METRSLPSRPPVARGAAASRLLAGPAAVLALALFASGALAQDDTLSKIVVNPGAAPSPDSAGVPQRDPSSAGSMPAQADASSQSGSVAPVADTSARKATAAKDALKNIVPTMKNIKAFGWGEYRVGGRCLCCDNMTDGDCIIVHNTNRTDRLRIKQIVDGKTEADTSDQATYFGDVLERDLPKPVTLLMAEITLNKPRDVRRVTVYTMVDREKSKSFLAGCELGYYDQFDRLQWAGKLENKANDDHLTFELDRPVRTGCLLIKARDGRSRITEVAIFAEDLKE